MLVPSWPSVTALTVFLILSAVVSEVSGAHAQEAVTVSRADLHSAYARSAMVNRWRRDRDPAAPILKIKAAAMAQSGASREEIVANLTQTRRAWEAEQAAGLRAEWQLDEDYKTMIRHGGALAGTAAPSRFGAAAGAAIADLGILTYEAFARDGQVQAASRDLGLRYETVKRAEDAIAEYVETSYRDNPVFREIFQEQFAAEMGFTPDDDVAAIARGFPEFVEQENVRAVMESLETGAAVVSLSDAERAAQADQMSSLLNGFSEQNAANLAEVEDTIVSELRERDAAHQRALEERERERIVFEGKRSAAFLATTVIGFIDPELGRQAEGVVSAAIQINRSIEAFNAASKLGDDVVGMASVALTGDVVGIALSLVGVFANSGPTPEELILGELAKIRQEVAQVRREMHERFNVVDAKLDALYARVDDGLMRLEAALGREVNRGLLAIQDSLREIDVRFVSATELLMNRTDLILVHLGADLATCINRKTVSRLPLGEEQFVDCALKLGYFLEQEVLAAAQTDLSPADGGAAELLRTRPNDVANASFQIFAALGEAPIAPPSIVGPRNWVYAAESYIGFMAEWPAHASLISVDQYRRLRVEGEKIAAASALMKDAFRLFASGEPSPVLEAVLHRLRERALRLDAAISLYEREFYQVQQRPPMHLIDGAPMELRPIAMQPDLREWPEGNCMQHERHYVAQAPDGADRFAPRLLREAADLGIGSFEYCLSFIYAQPGQEQVIGEGGAQDLNPVLACPRFR